MKRLVVLDERWDSALTDLGVKIARVLKGETACAVVRGSPAEKKCREANLKCFYIEDPRKKLPFKPFVSLLRAISSFRPDAVLTVRGEETLFSALLKKRFGFKLYRLHGEARGIRDSFLNGLFHKRFIDGIIVPSESFLNKAVKGIPYVTVPGAVDTETFRFSPEGRERVRRELRVKEEETLFGVIGRLDPVKGHKLFIRSLAVLKVRKLHFKALILGEEKNTSVEELDILARAFSVRENLIFITRRRRDIADVMSAVDIGVVPSVGSEVLVRTPLEFMACGKPVVATSVGVLGDVVTGETGIVVPPEEMSLANGLERATNLFKRPYDPRIREVACERYSLNALCGIVNDFIS